MQWRDGCCSESQRLCLVPKFTHECILIKTVEKNSAETTLIKIHTALAVCPELSLSLSQAFFFLVWFFLGGVLYKFAL